MLKHLSEFLVAVVTMIGSLATIYVKYLLDQRAKAKVDVVKISQEHDLLIYDKLEEVRQALDSDRVYLIQYHNGSFYKSGQSMLKMSMSHEVCAPGISREIQGAQNLPLSLFADSVGKFYSEGKLNVPNVADDPDLEESVRQMYLGRGIKSAYCAPVRDLQGRVMGSLCVNYVTELYDMPKKELDYLHKNTLVMSGYMRSISTSH